MKHGVSDLVDKEDLSIGSIVQGSMRQCSTDGARSLDQVGSNSYSYSLPPSALNDAKEVRENFCSYFNHDGSFVARQIFRSPLKINFLLNSKCYYSFFVAAGRITHFTNELKTLSTRVTDMMKRNTHYQSILICLLNLSTKVSNSRLIAIAIYFTLAIAYNYKHITGCEKDEICSTSGTFFFNYN
ncbi:hypothetical protein BLOT_004079 [Blomia tropicalis]|nr:hypothetical protein BLOT_004079 [Blomia tropicalis]